MKKQLLLALLLIPASLAIGCADSPQSDEIVKEDMSECRFNGELLACESLIQAEICNPDAMKPCQIRFDYPFFYENITIEECYVVHGNVTMQCREPLVLEENVYLWGGSRALAAVLPSCEAGDVYTIRFNRTYDDPIEGALEDGWSFSGWSSINGMPAYSEHSRYELVVPSGTEVRYKLHSADATFEKYSGDETRYIFEQRDILPEKPEEYSPAQDVTTDWLEVTNAKDYSTTAAWARGLFEQEIKPDATVAAKAAELANGSTGEEAIEKIYEWVRQNIRYVPLEFGPMTGFKPHNASDVLSKGYGDCKDFSALLAALLRSRGFDAEPVLLSPMQTEHLDGFDIFNHLIVVVSFEGKDIWLDGTCDSCPYGSLPYGEHGCYALRFMSRDSLEQLPPHDEVESRLLAVVNYTVLADGTVHISQAVHDLDPLSAEGSRLYFKSLNADELRESFEAEAASICGAYSGLEYNLSSLEPGKGEFVASAEFDCSGLAKASGDSMQLAGYAGKRFMVPGFLSVSERENDFYFGSNDVFRTEMRFEFPEGYEVVTDMAGVDERFEGYRLKLDYSREANTAAMALERFSAYKLPKEMFSSRRDASIKVENALKQPLEAELAHAAPATEPAYAVALVVAVVAILASLYYLHRKRDKLL